MWSSISASTRSSAHASRLPLSRFARRRRLSNRPSILRFYSRSPPPPKTISDLFDTKTQDQPVHDVVVQGFVRSVRTMKNHRFVSLSDGSCMTPLQAVLPAGVTDSLATGAAVRLIGDWVVSRGAGQSHELQAKSVEVLGPSNAETFPLQKKYQSPEYLRTIPHLRLRTPFNSNVLQLRSQMIVSLTRYFEHRYVQTHPPLITSSDCEGAGEVFEVAPAAETNTSENKKPAERFFRSPKYLTVSTQLHLEALAQAVGNVWTLSPTFRAEKSDTFRHLSEFYMLEAEASFVNDLSEVMDELEAMLRFLVETLDTSRAAEDLLSPTRDTAGTAPRSVLLQRWQGLTEGRYPRITYTEAIEHLRSCSANFTRKPVWGQGLQAEHEKHIAEVIGKGRPVFVTHYPRSLKPFYMLPTSGSSQDGGESATVDCFDLLVPEFCEIAGGSMREHRLGHLLEAMKAHGLGTPSELDHRQRIGSASASSHQTSESQTPDQTGGALDWYVDLRRWGCPPHGGFGLGFDRLLAYLSGVQTVRDVVAFPRWYGRCDC